MKLEFEDKYVAFIDVLGFSSLVENNAHQKLQDYFNILSEIFEAYDKKKQEIQKFSISDSVILVAKDSENDFKNLLVAIRSLQCALAYFNIWVRGGIAFGPVYCNEKDNIIVGKGYIKAYLLEKEAVYPRVIIDPTILRKMNLNLRQFCEKFNGPHKPDSFKLIHDYAQHKRLTENDAIFVCYVNKIMIQTLRERTTYGEDGIQMLLNDLKENLYGPQKHYAKYLWLKKYFHEILLELNNYIGQETLDKERINKYLIEFNSL